MRLIPSSIINLDKRLFLAVNRLAKKSRGLDFFAVSCATYMPYALFALIFILALWWEDIEMLIVSLLSLLAARFLINETVYFIYQRKRPMELLTTPRLIPKPNHPSFPSGHAAVSFAMSFSLIPYHATLAVVFFLLSSLNSLCRIFCGVHWPSDAFGGAVSGFLAFLIFYLFV